jgi:hypothetical protein
MAAGFWLSATLVATVVRGGSVDAFAIVVIPEMTAPTPRGSMWDEAG